MKVKKAENHKQGEQAYKNLIELEKLRRKKYGVAACEAPMERVFSIHRIPDDPREPDPRD